MHGLRNHFGSCESFGTTVLQSSLQNICVCITRAMTPGLKRTSSGSSTHVAPNVPQDGDEHACDKKTTRDMPRSAAEHAAFLENSYVTAIIDSAWSAWSWSRLLSLARIKELIMKETHEPVTLEALLHAEPPRTRQQKRSWWSNIESISRCVAAYHHAISASEHDSCRLVQRNICAYAFTLRRGLPSNVDVTEFFTLLHRAITNRALNMALRATVDKSLRNDFLVGPDSRCMAHSGRHALADILEHCLDSVKTDYQALRNRMKQLRDGFSE